MKRIAAIFVSLLAFGFVGCSAAESEKTVNQLDRPLALEEPMGNEVGNLKVEIVRPPASSWSDGRPHDKNKDAAVVKRIKEFVEALPRREIIRIDTHTRDGFVVGAEIYYR